MMTEIFAQGDLLLERYPMFRQGAAMVLAEGEASGHRHATGSA